MIYFIHSPAKIPDQIKDLIKSNYSIFVFSNSKDQSNHFYEVILNNNEIVPTIFANLKEQKNILILSENTLELKLPKDLIKNRILVGSNFLYLHPRASYFFKNESDKMNFTTYEECKATLQAWGK